ncbi:MAG TPA: GspH/FimT family pseudopilin, partial [Myxococcota bacterium]|nr:GspH/FimT family pseudopilin [Myxococcota bacterium]
EDRPGHGPGLGPGPAANPTPVVAGDHLLSTPRTRLDRGFTLIELMLTIAILGIMAGMSVGYSGQWRRNSVVKEATRNIVAALTLARSQAIRGSARTAVSVSGQRVVAFFDTNNNQVQDAGEATIFRFPTGTASFASSLAVTSNGLQAGAGTSAGVTFEFQGFAVRTDGTPVSGVICIKDADIGDVRAIELSMGGAARIQAWVTAGGGLCP